MSFPALPSGQRIVLLYAEVMIGNMQKKVTAAGDLSDAANARAALAAVAKAQAKLLILRNLTDVAVNNATQNAVGAGRGGIVASAADLLAVVADIGVLAALTQAEGYVGRASVNLGGQPWQ